MSAEGVNAFAVVWQAKAKAKSALTLTLSRAPKEVTLGGKRERERESLDPSHRWVADAAQRTVLQFRDTRNSR
ncbi:hypothetical protein [Lysobacter gummosus]|uniref:Uncharacterized protein n=1 Tax=Lysobacter gummosus TaxID=262324 RepID=A0ABY3XAY0_9GAMM|nr:hypothetical protein [Lysobacter gummosus]UNP29759.1 hypothetical protein MOV92_00275 [Lysobacter gummosus]